MRKIDVSNMFPCTVGELVEALDPSLLVFFDSKNAGYLNTTTITIYDEHIDISDDFEDGEL